MSEHNAQHCEKEALQAKIPKAFTKIFPKDKINAN